jgi:hypothetical protein
MNPTKGSGLDAANDQPAKTLTKCAADSMAPAKGFVGTSNPRQLRAITVLLRRPVSRKDIDGIVGCSNAPELIAELRRQGLDLPCERIEFIDRDNKVCRPGVYSLTATDRRRINAWLATRGSVSNGKRA